MSERRSPVSGFIAIAVVVCGAAGAFAYTAGWLSPQRLTASKVVDALAPSEGPALGYRRNHAKGICFTGSFEASGDASAISYAAIFTRGQYPVIGRLNLAGPTPSASDDTGCIRGLSI